MKTILIFLLILYIPFEIIYSQINKKTIVTGGSINLSAQKLYFAGEYKKYYSIDFQPAIGYFLFKNFSASIVPIFSYSYSKMPNIINAIGGYLKDESIGLGIAPEITYYFLDKRIHPFFRFETAFLIEKFNKDEIYFDPLIRYTLQGNRTNRRFSPGVGIMYMLNEHVGLDANLKYSWIHTLIEYTNDPSGFHSDYDIDDTRLDLFFGIKVFIFSKSISK